MAEVSRTSKPWRESKSTDDESATSASSPRPDASARSCTAPRKSSIPLDTRVSPPCSGAGRAVCASEVRRMQGSELRTTRCLSSSSKRTTCSKRSTMLGPPGYFFEISSLACSRRELSKSPSESSASAGWGGAEKAQTACSAPSPSRTATWCSTCEWSSPRAAKSAEHAASRVAVLVRSSPVTGSTRSSAAHNHEATDVGERASARAANASAAPRSPTGNDGNDCTSQASLWLDMRVPSSRYHGSR
mmetsp:Transcript_37233/g.92659  ORF Transcript_37233/g.92659 Transcript_37233/m.92659 type:complete len:246 (-) Transcript_37233:301-1038(-)